MKRGKFILVDDDPGFLMALPSCSNKYYEVTIRGRLGNVQRAIGANLLSKEQQIA